MKSVAVCFLLFGSAAAFLRTSKAEKESSQEAQWQAEVEAIMKNMTLGERAAQMLQIEAGAVDMDTYLPFVGSIMYSGNREINDNKKEDWYNFAKTLQDSSATGPHGIPIFIGADSVHGQSHLRDTTIFPHNINLGCSRNKSLVELVAKVTAEESAATGINYIFAPCLDVVQDIRWGRTYESFSQDPQLVNELGSAFVTGAQSVDTAMLTSAKHFIAAGATKYGTGYFIKPEMTAELKDKKREKYQKEHPHWNLKHYDPKVKFEELPRQPLDRGNAQLNQKELYTKHMIPYWGAVSAGTGSIMTSYSSVNGVPSHANAELLQYLKGEKGMNYQGFVITDYAGIDMIDRNYSIALPKAINAGIDMVMLPGTTSGCNPWLDGVCPTAMSFIKDMIKHVGEGRISEDRVNDACKRVLMAKKRHGLFNQPLAPKELLNKVGSQEHRQLAREAAQQGTVVLSNKHKALPLNLNEEKVCLAGEAADNLGMQLGGWSLRWQGFSGNDQTKGTTLWQAMQKRMPHAVYDKTGKCEGADTVIAVVGEAPYAEGYGDSKELNLSEDDAKMLKKVYEGKRSSLLETEAEDGSNGRRVILITMAGRPLWMEQQIAKADAFVAAFVPGIEGGQGVLDALTADYQPSGKLSITWPRDGKAPVTEESPGGSVLFEMGYGLSYDKNGWGREL